MKTLSILLLSLSLTAWDNYYDDYEESNTYGYEVARVTYCDDDILVLRNGGEEVLVRNLPIAGGDQIETRYDGYAEIGFLDGTLLQVDMKTELEFQAVYEVYDGEALTVLKLHRGSVFLHVTQSPDHLNSRVYRIDTPNGSAYIESPGIYRIDYTSPRMRLKTFRGGAELSGRNDSVLVRSGQFSTISNRFSPHYPRSFNTFATDRFERWANQRTPYFDSVSSQYVDSSLSYYARDLDDHGNWYYENDLGTQVWVPRVRQQWRPYSTGYWTRCGTTLTWVSLDPFGWVTHHYGRWGYSARWGWYWIPGRYYSPAWVSWSSYDNNLGWCPLGYYNRPYYYGRSGVSIHVNIRNHWTFVNSHEIRDRRARRTYRDDVAGLRVTARPLHVTRTEFNNPKEIIRVVKNRDEVHRRHSEFGMASRGLVSRDTEKRTAINSRHSGTSHESRIRTSSSSDRRAVNRSEFSERKRETYGQTDNHQRSTNRTPSDRTQERKTTNRSNTTRSTESNRSRSNSTTERKTDNQRSPRAVKPYDPKTNTDRSKSSNQSKERSKENQRRSSSSYSNRAPANERKATPPQRSSERKATSNQRSSSSNNRSSANQSRSSSKQRATPSQSSNSKQRATSSRSSNSSRQKATSSSRSSRQKATSSSQKSQRSSRAKREKKDNEE